MQEKWGVITEYGRQISGQGVGEPLPKITCQEDLEDSNKNYPIGLDSDYLDPVGTQIWEYPINSGIKYSVRWPDEWPFTGGEYDSRGNLIDYIGKCNPPYIELLGRDPKADEDGVAA